MTPVAIVLTILALAVVAFMSNRVPMGIVALGVAVSLWATGLLSLPQALAGFGDPTVIFIASLFVVSDALDSTGVTAWAGQQVVSRGGTSRVRLLLLICLLVAGLTALISVNGAVAALIPMVVVAAVRVGIPPSQMLMPLAFSAHAGSLLALTGTPVNIIVSDAAADAGARPFTFFEFGLAGLPLLVGTLAIIVLFGKRLLPHRSPHVIPPDVGNHVLALRAQYDLPESTRLVSPRTGFAEVVIPPRSELIGTRLFPGMTTPSGDLVVLGLQRGGEDVTGPDVAGHLAQPRGADRRPGRPGRGRAGQHAPVGAARGRRQAGDRRAGGHGGAAGHRRRAAGHRRRAGRVRGGAAARPDAATGVPRGVMDNGRAGRRHDPAFDGLHHHRHRRPDRRLAQGPGGWDIAAPGAARHLPA